jgi:O-antigen/teichoic acid export membrane protein
METKTIMKNASYLFLGNITVRFVLAISTILFARAVTPEEYADLVVALAVSAIVCYFTDIGLTQTFMREGTKKDANISELISSYLRVRLILAAILSILFVIFAPSFYTDTYQRTLIYMVVLPTMFGASLQGIGMVYFQVTERMQFSALIAVLQGLTAASTLLLGMTFDWSIMTVAATYGASSLVTGCIAVMLVLRYTKIHQGWNKQILNELLTFTVNGVIVMMLPQLGPIILDKVSSPDDVAFFGTASKIPAVLYQIPGVIAAAFYPRLFALGNDKKVEEHRKLSHFELKLMSFLGIGIAIPFIAHPEYWIVSLLTDTYAPAADALAILGFMVILQSINYPLADYLTTIGHQWKRTTIMTIGLIVAIVGYIVLGYKFGMVGGAIAAIVTEVVLLIGFTIFIKKGYSLVIKGVTFNLIAFAISYAIYNMFLVPLYPLIALTITVILYGMFVVALDRQIRTQVQEFIQTKLTRKVSQ